MDAVTVRAPAKINLFLGVGAPRRDGFHPLATVYQAIGLYDELVATPADDVTVRVTGPGSDGVPPGEDNLAVRAARLLQARFGVRDGAALTLRKTIPVAGGMAGGSTDAAAALVACDALWGTDVTREELLALAATLGSDVPFCLVGGTAIGTGRGERISPALARGAYEWVVAFADSGLSTPIVYSELDRLRRGRTVGEPQIDDAVMNALRRGDAEVLGRALSNDLQPAALRLRPKLRQVLAVGEDSGALGSLVSGSGPTCLFLAKDRDQALDIAVNLTSAGVCASVKQAPAPVPGARVIG